MKMVYVKIDPDIFNSWRRYCYIATTTDKLAQFAMGHNLDATQSIIERDLALRGKEIVEKLIYDTYVKPIHGVRWFNSAAENSIRVRVPDEYAEGYNTTAIPEVPGYNDYISKLFPEFPPEYRPKNITFQITEACNLRCTYCYQIAKTNTEMSTDTALSYIDALLDDKIPYCTTENSCGIALEMIGGEPFLEIELIDKVTEYLLTEVIRRNHPWKNFIRISLSTNGVLYRDPRVQEYLNKYKYWISLSVSVDGNKELHDACRVFPDGSGSYDMAIDAAKDWVVKTESLIQQTKATLAPGNIRYTADAVISLIENGYNVIHINTVYEEGWTLNDARIFYREMKKIIDYMFEHNLYNSIYLRLFEEDNFRPMEPGEDNDRNWCGGNGEMLSFDNKGVLYPCLRFMPSSLGDVPPITMGKYENGDFSITEKESECLHCLQCVDRKTQSTEECYNCPIAKGCAWCTAYNYQKFGTPNHRATFICWMHKARALANYEFWNRYYEAMHIDKHMDNYMEQEWIDEILKDPEY